ncbi:hypothetical protein ZWY2020_021165 [Hordeum vulgare]|nr:hypothetical protein ZWY2020_021165 [Hordeum vulgare]
MARPEVAGSGTGRHGCGRDDNDGRRGEPPCDGPPPWRWSSFSIAASSTCLAAPWTHLAAAWSICCRRRLLALTRKEMPDWSRHGRGGGVPPASVCGSTSVAPSSDRKVSIMCDECMVASMEWPKITSYRLLTEKGTPVHVDAEHKSPILAGFSAPKLGNSFAAQTWCLSHRLPMPSRLGSA